MNSVGPSYFPMMHLPLVNGRLFGAADPDAIVISESAALRLWPKDSPLGKTIVVKRRARTVIGVVKDSGVNLLTNPETVEAYTPIDDGRGLCDGPGACHG